MSSFHEQEDAQLCTAYIVKLKRYTAKPQKIEQFSSSRESVNLYTSLGKSHLYRKNSIITGKLLKGFFFKIFTNSALKNKHTHSKRIKTKSEILRNPRVVGIP